MADDKYLPGLLETVDLRMAKPGRANPWVGLLNEVVDPPELGAGSEIGYTDEQGFFHVTNPEARQTFFDNWFKGSKMTNSQGEPQTYYHGTPHFEGTEFDVSKIGKRDLGWHGRGIYFTKSPKLAGGYAESVGEFLGGQTPSGEDSVKVYANDFNEYSNELIDEIEKGQAQEEGYDSVLEYAQDLYSDSMVRFEESKNKYAPEIIPVHLNLNNPLKLGYKDKDGPNRQKIININPSDFNKLVDATVDSLSWINHEYPGTQEQARDLLKEEESYGNIIDFLEKYALDRTNLSDIAEEAGFDGISVSDGSEVIIFDPGKAKSIFNRGTYDPENPDILSQNRIETGLLQG